MLKVKIKIKHLNLGTMHVPPGIKICLKYILYILYYSRYLISLRIVYFSHWVCYQCHFHIKLHSKPDVYFLLCTFGITVYNKMYMSSNASILYKKILLICKL